MRKNKPTVLMNRVLSNGKNLPLYDTVDVSYVVEDLGKEVDACKQILAIENVPKKMRANAEQFIELFEPGLNGYKEYLKDIEDGKICGYKF